MAKQTDKTYRYVSVLSSILIILVWFIISKALNAPILLPSPNEVLRTTVEIFKTRDFISNVGATIIRALISFLIIIVSGTLCGLLAGRFIIFKKAISPLISLFKATPVMSIILLAFIWLKSSSVPIFSAFLMAFPIMFVQTMDAYSHIDTKLEQMCIVYDIKGTKRIKALVVPSLIPSIITGSRQTLSMILKVVIAAEVIILPKQGIGRSLQLAQIQLETCKVFAWTIVAVILTVLSDNLFELILKKLQRKHFSREEE